MHVDDRSVTPVPKIEDDCYDWYLRHRTCCELVRRNRYDLVFIGDSITHFWNASDGPCNGGKSWEEFFGSYRALNLGFGFDRTQNVLWRLAHGELDGQSPKMIVLNIGTNQFSASSRYPADTPEDASRGILEVVRVLRASFLEAYLLVMAIFPRGEALDNPFRALIRETNRLTRLGVSDMPGTGFLDLEKSFIHADGGLDEALFLPCFTHPNEAGYRVWGRALRPELERVLE